MQGGYGPVLGQINSECKDPSTLWFVAPNSVPYNPGVLDRFMDSRSGKGPSGADVTAWGRAGYVMGWNHK